MNRIIDDSDSKPSEFKCQIWSDSKSDDEFGLELQFWLNWIKFDLFLVKLEQFWIKCQLKDQKGHQNCQKSIGYGQNPSTILTNLSKSFGNDQNLSKMVKIDWKMMDF